MTKTPKQSVAIKCNPSKSEDTPSPTNPSEILGLEKNASTTQRLGHSGSQSTSSTDANICNCGTAKRECFTSEGLEVETYMRDALTFLSKYSWIYDFQLTHLLTDSVLEHLPEEVIVIFACKFF